MYYFESLTDLYFLYKVAVKTNWDCKHFYLPVKGTHLLYMLSNWHCPTNVSRPSQFFSFFFNDFFFGFPITNDAPFCSPKNRVIPSPPLPRQIPSQGRSVAEIKKHGGGGDLLRIIALSAQKRKRYKTSRNEYSKEILGEISTVAYNTSLENTNYRNRYCN